MRVPYGNICTGPPHPSSISLIRRYSLVQPFGNLAPSLTLTQSVSQSRYPYRWRRQVIRIIRSFVACIRNTFCACKYFSSYYSASLSLSLSLSPIGCSILPTNIFILLFNTGGAKSCILFCPLWTSAFIHYLPNKRASSLLGTINSQFYSTIFNSLFQ